MKKLRILLRGGACVLCAALALTLACNGLVLQSAKPHIQTEQTLSGHYDCILVPGALVRGETLSVILQDRMDRGISLFASGVADALLLTGDSEISSRYDEVGAMAGYATQAGIAEGQILQDPLGLSTYASLWRAKNVYGMQRVLIVTQEFHLSRALYLAERLGLDATGVACDAHIPALKNHIRETAARVKAVWDGLWLPEP